jgi:hypothetical protein
MRKWILAATFVAGAVTVLVLQRDHADRPSPAADAAASSGFTASDVALLATTGRPQLVEFFHHL